MVLTQPAATRPRRRSAGQELDAAGFNELVTSWQRDGDRSAREELVLWFTPLARKLAGRYRNANEPLEDLVQVAHLGLLGAIDRFDPSHGAAFSSFAVPTILGELKRHFRDTGWSVHVPRGRQELALRVDRAIAHLNAVHGRTPSIDAIAEHLGISAEDALQGLEASAAHYTASLDAPTRGDDPDEATTLGDTLGTDDDRLGLVEMSVSLSAAIDRLPHLERRALALRVQYEMKQSEISEVLGCSQMQVSRMLRRAASTLGALTAHEALGTRAPRTRTQTQTRTRTQTQTQTRTRSAG